MIPDRCRWHKDSLLKPGLQTRVLSKRLRTAERLNDSILTVWSEREARKVHAPLTLRAAGIIL